MEPKNIFIIEDSKIISELIKLNLKKSFNSRFFLYNNCDDAFTDVPTLKPDLLLLDYHYSNKSLFYQNALEFLKAFRRKYKTPVIVFSGDKEDFKKKNLLKYGVENFIEKDDDLFFENLTISIKNFNRTFWNRF